MTKNDYDDFQEDVRKVLDNLRCNHMFGGLYQKWVGIIDDELKNELHNALDEDAYDTIQYYTNDISEKIVERLYR